MRNYYSKNKSGGTNCPLTEALAEIQICKDFDNRSKQYSDLNAL